MKPPACVSCGGELVFHRRYTFTTAIFRQVYKGDRVFRCTQCNLSQADMSLVDESALAAYYSRNYRVDTGDIAVLSPTSAAIYRRRANALADLAQAHLGRRPARVFEVGAGYGFNLHEFSERFPDAWVGTDEPSSVASQHHSARIERAQLADGDYDVIILSHVLEHFTDPAGILRQSAQALADDGVIVIEVPNDVDGILRYNGRDEPHLTFFEVETLSRLFANAGVTVSDLFGAGPPNVKDTLALRSKRLVRDLLGATPVGRALLHRRSSAHVLSDDRFDQRNADGLFIRAALKA